MSEIVKILIADDHPIFRAGARLMIESEKSFSVVAEADNGTNALALIEKHQPHVAVLDIDMPELDGFAAARLIKEKNLPVEVIFLTMHGEEKLFQAALKLGIKGYVLKDSAQTDIVKAIKSVLQGDPFLSPELSRHIIKRMYEPAISEDGAGLDTLSPTQRRVLKLIADDKTSREIAEILCISQRTVDTHRAKIILKLKLQGSLALVKFAMLHKSEI